jgi:hypothetical protein
MSEHTTTPYSSKLEILSELWIDYRNDDPFQDLFRYGDLAFPLAYSIHEKLVESTPLVEEYIHEVWDILLAELELEDTGFETLTELFEASPTPKE